MSVWARRRPHSRATTRPFVGSSTTRTPGMPRAAAAVSSVLGVVDDDDVVGRPGLSFQRKEAGGKIRRFIVGTHDHGDRQGHRVVFPMNLSVRGACNNGAARASYSCELWGIAPAPRLERRGKAGTGAFGT